MNFCITAATMDELQKKAEHAHKCDETTINNILDLKRELVPQVYSDPNLNNQILASLTSAYFIERDLYDGHIKSNRERKTPIITLWYQHILSAILGQQQPLYLQSNVGNVGVDEKIYVNLLLEADSSVQHMAVIYDGFCVKKLKLQSSKDLCIECYDYGFVMFVYMVLVKIHNNDNYDTLGDVIFFLFYTYKVSKCSSCNSLSSHFIF